MFVNIVHNVASLFISSVLLFGRFHPAKEVASQQSMLPFSDLEVPTGNSQKSIWSNQIPASQPPPSETGNWLGWGGDVYNNHWASSDAVIDSSNVGSLSLVCQKKYSPGVSAAPLVIDGIAYFPTWSGLLVALDYKSCHTIWSTNITHLIVKHKPLTLEQKSLVATVSRTTPVIDKAEDVLYIGTIAQALLMAIDRKTGKLVDALQLDTHPFAVLTQSPTFYQGCLFIGVSSVEEGAPDVVPNYTCCYFTGSMHAAALEHGRLRLLWSQSMIPAGSDFSGAAIWGSQPAIDPIRKQVFVSTGNLYSLPLDFQACQNQTANITVIKEGLTSDPCLPREVLQETVLALDLDTGRINWIRQLGVLDAWNAACVSGLLGPPIPGSSGACPPTPGLDADFGMAPTFVLGSEHTPYELDLVVVGQKNGNLYALSAASGMLLWTISTGPDGLEGGLNWGVSVDDTAVYYTAINLNRVNYTLPAGDGNTVISNSAFGAASLKDGHILWQTAAPRNTTSIVANAVANDVVFVGATGNWSSAAITPVGPGSFLSLDKKNGRILEEVPLDAYFHGAFAVVHDLIMFGTGYGGLEAPQEGSFQVWKIGD